MLNTKTKPQLSEILWPSGAPSQQALIRVRGSATISDGKINFQLDGISESVRIRSGHWIRNAIVKNGGVTGSFSCWPKTERSGRVTIVQIVSFHQNEDDKADALRPGQGSIIGQWRGCSESGVGCITLKPQARDMKAFPIHVKGAEAVRLANYGRLAMMVRLADGALEMDRILFSNPPKKAGNRQKSGRPTPKKQKPRQSVANISVTPANKPADPLAQTFDAVLLSAANGTVAFQCGRELRVLRGSLDGARTGVRYRVLAKLEGKVLVVVSASKLG